MAKIPPERSAAVSNGAAAAGHKNNAKAKSRARFRKRQARRRAAKKPKTAAESGNETTVHAAPSFNVAIDDSSNDPTSTPTSADDGEKSNEETMSLTAGHPTGDDRSDEDDRQEYVEKDVGSDKMKETDEVAKADCDTEHNVREADGEAGSEGSIDGDDHGNGRSGNNPLACFAALGEKLNISHEVTCKKWMALIRSFMTQKGAPRAMKRPRGLFPIWV